MFKFHAKLIISLLCISCLMLSLSIVFALQRQDVGSPVRIVYTASKDFLTYELNAAQNGFIVTGYNPDKVNGKTAIEIPDEHTANGRTLPVTEIGDRAFALASQFTSLKIGENVEVIGECAFNETYCLRGDLIIPDSVRSVGRYAFSCAGDFSSLTIGSGLEEFGDFMLNATSCDKLIVNNIFVYQNLATNWESFFLAAFIHKSYNILASIDDGSNTQLNDTSMFSKSTTVINGKNYNVYSYIE